MRDPRSKKAVSPSSDRVWTCVTLENNPERYYEVVGNKGGDFRDVSGVQFQGTKNFPFFLEVLEVTLGLTAIYISISRYGELYDHRKNPAPSAQIPVPEMYMK